MYIVKLNHKITGIVLLVGALSSALLIATAHGSHLGPGSPEDDIPSALFMVAIIVAVLGTILFMTGRLKMLVKTSS